MTNFILSSPLSRFPNCSYLKLVQSTTFWFGLMFGAKIFLISIFFRNYPVLGTLTIGLLVAAFFGFVLLTILHGKLPLFMVQWPASGKLLFAFLFWSGFSLLWTHADSNFTAFGYWALMSMEVFLVYLLVSIGSIEKVVTSFLRGYIFGSVILGFIALFLSEGTVDNRLGDELFLHTNFIGNQIAIALILTLYFIPNKSSSRFIWVSIFLFLLLILFRSLSKTSIFAFGLAVIFYLLRSKMNGKIKVLIIGMISLGFLPSYNLLDYYIQNYIKYTQGGEAIYTLSGRITIWHQVFDMIKEKPVLGYGFFSFRDSGPDIAIALGHTTAHSEWLTVWFSLGLIGLALTLSIYSAFYFALRKAALSIDTRSQSEMGLALLIFVLIRGLTESVAAGLIFPLPLVLLIIAWISKRSCKIYS